MIPAAVVEIVWHRDRRVVVVGLALATAAAWAWTLGGMDMAEAGSAAMLPAAWSPGHAAWMFAMWWVMMAAMMLPGAVPLVLTAAAVHRRQGEAGRPELTAGLLAAGYLAVWGLFSLAATLAQRALEGRGLIAPGAAGVSLPPPGGFPWRPASTSSPRSSGPACGTAARRSGSSAGTGVRGPPAPCGWASRTVSTAWAAAGR